MTVDARILSALREMPWGVSGAELSRKLAMTRAGVWGHIEQLRDLGYDIDHGAQATTASSRHPGGVNVAFADGAVRFIANKINLYPWQAMGSIAGQERVVDEY